MCSPEEDEENDVVEDGMVAFLLHMGGRILFSKKRKPRTDTTIKFDQKIPIPDDLTITQSNRDEKIQ